MIIRSEGPNILQIPEAESTAESCQIVSQAGAIWQTSKILGVATADDNIIHNENCHQETNGTIKGTTPKALAEAPQATPAKFSSQGLASLASRHITKFQRDDDVV
ncbi:MAG TPA: hypothetical protein VE988_14420 [Gemmataceae bacterium]|nr:hypothetical protein [Gemmataceae bacterium]